MLKVKHLLLFLILFAIPAITEAQLSDQARVSLLTASPHDGEVFTLYGHTALRISDPQLKKDLVFNYGTFSFDKPYFIYRFSKGEMDYELGIDFFSRYIIPYQMRGSEVIEQVLDLTLEEKNRIWNFLANNYRPENRVYRYNFFFDNCSTRPRDIVEQCVNGRIAYVPETEKFTFRDLINDCTRNHPWQTFGCDLALGAPTDATATDHETLFLPRFLKNAFDKATIVSPDGSTRKLVSSTSILTETSSDETENSPAFFTPLVCGWLLFVLIAGITYREWKHRTYYRSVDIILFSIAGIAGCVLFFLSFFTVHPCTSPNWSLIWLNPVQLVAVILFAVKKARKAAYYYHFINFAALTLFLAGWHWIPQQFNPAFIPLILTLWVRSGYGVYRYIKNR